MTKNVARTERGLSMSSRRAGYGPGPSSDVNARHLLLAQSTGAGSGLPAAGGGDEDDEGGDDMDEGSRSGDAAAIGCSGCPVPESGRHAVTNTPMISTQRITLMITSG